MIEVKRERVGNFEVVSYEDDAYCYVEVYDAYGNLVDKQSMATCTGFDYDELKRKYS